MKSDPTPKPPMSPRRTTRQSSPNRPFVPQAQGRVDPVRVATRGDVERSAAPALHGKIHGQIDVGQPEQELQVIGPAAAEGAHQCDLIHVDLALDLAAERCVVGSTPAESHEGRIRRERPGAVVGAIRGHRAELERVEHIRHADVDGDLDRPDLGFAVDRRAHAVDEHRVLPACRGLRREGTGSGKQPRQRDCP
jgi:hypothetical protein